MTLPIGVWIYPRGGTCWHWVNNGPVRPGQAATTLCGAVVVDVADVISPPGRFSGFSTLCPRCVAQPMEPPQ